jgi:2-oxoglutarate ferredoxin oxidoreductase subunit beta
MAVMTPENLVYVRPSAFTDTPTHYCPGSTHGVAHRLVAEVLDEMEVTNCTIGVAPVGCSVFMYNYFATDFVEAAHGRAPAMATGIKRVRPQNLVFSYQGDGDLAAIGTAEGLHAANRGENITVIFVNNGVYGMTGGQMAPTTLLDQVTTTTPTGRDAGLAGHPVRICEVFAQLDGTSYLERVAVNRPAAVVKARKAIRKAFQRQIDGSGFSLVEILSPCPVNWKMGPLEACKWVDEAMVAYFPLGVFKEVEAC